MLTTPDEPTTLSNDNNKLFRIVLKLLRGEPLAGEPRAASDKAPVEEAPVQPWALCIDDDPDFCLALEMRLKAHGIGMSRAADGMEGYRCAFTGAADVILLDYELPNGRGDYILDRLKGNPVTKDIPVIVITGHKDRALERELINTGAKSVMSKPPDIKTLVKEFRCTSPH